MQYKVNARRALGVRDTMIYGHFIEHFHRQIYGGVYQPGHPTANADGLREDVLAAMRRIKVPVLRWPGGCFVSSYHWKDAVGQPRTPFFDKAWRVEDPNTFGTDEYVAMCRAIGCEPYICTNAGTGTAEEMSDWVEYCNLQSEGQWAKRRIANRHETPHRVKYWSIGNENYGFWELGAKQTGEWGSLVLESAKLIKHVDPTVELTAAALTDLDWNIDLLRKSAQFLDWISIHEYWDKLHHVNDPASYGACMAYTRDLDAPVLKVKGLLAAMGLEKKIRIAFDEWNLRGWYHPNAHTVYQGRTKDEYLTPRDENDDNGVYTMADAVFTACFLHMCHRHCDVVGMANFAPIVNTRGCIYTHGGGIVLRGTYHVFDLYVNHLGDEVLDGWLPEGTESFAVQTKDGESASVETLDLLATRHSESGMLALGIINKHPAEKRSVCPVIEGAAPTEYRLCTVNGPHADSYNDVGREEITLCEGEWKPYDGGKITVEPHSVNVLQLR